LQLKLPELGVSNDVYLKFHSWARASLPCGAIFRPTQAEDNMQSFNDNPALRAQLESQVDFMTEFTQRAYDAIRQLSDINLKLARQSTESALYAGRELLSCSDPAKFIETAMKQVPPATERMRVYQQQLLGVIAGAQQEFTRAAEARMPEASRYARVAADAAGDMARQAAAGGNVAVSGSASGSTSGSTSTAAQPGGDWPDHGNASGATH
jgi:phasin family protein